MPYNRFALKFILAESQIFSSYRPGASDAMPGKIEAVRAYKFRYEKRYGDFQIFPAE